MVPRNVPQRSSAPHAACRETASVAPAHAARRASLSLTAKHTLQRLHYGGVRVRAWLQAWFSEVVCVRA